MITIKPYSQENKETLVKLIEELQDYLAQIDPLHRLRRLPGYGEAYIEKLLKKIGENEGVIYIAYERKIPLGFIAGAIKKQDADNLLECVPTKGGRILELIVAEKHRGKSIGSLLMKKMEEYFRQNDCDIVRVEVFEPNKPAHNFYKKCGYNDRIIDMVKRV